MGHGWKRWRRNLASLLASAVAAPAASGSLVAQEVADFDIERAYQADSTLYEPFRVGETRPLAEALRAGDADPLTSVLVIEHPRAGRLALVTDQMAYHHVAQGEIAGEPWMVSF